MLLPLIGAAWLFGFAAKGALGAPWWLAGAALACGAAGATWRLGPRRGALLGAIALATLAGGLRFELGVATPDEPPGTVFTGELTISGTIASEPDPAARSVTYRLAIDASSAHEHALEGAAVLVTLHQYTELLPGDRLRVRGRIEQPSANLDGFDHRAWLLARGIVGRMPFPTIEAVERGPASRERLSARLRLHIERVLEHALPEPEAALAAGIAVGRDDGMPPALVEDFRVSGLSHLTAVSGGNVAIVSAVAFALLVPVAGRKWAVAPAVAIVAACLVAAGFEATIVRASIMAWIFLAGLWLGRPQSGLSGLAVAAIAMTAWSPAIARDVGFQLSLAATAGLILLTPWFSSAATWLAERAGIGAIVGTWPLQALSFTLAATVATLPIVAHTFERVSLSGFIANIAAQPLFVVAFTLSLGVALAGSAWEPAGWLLGLAAYYPLAAINALARAAAAPPGAAVSTGGLGAAAATVWLCALGAAGAALYLRPLPPVVRREASRRDLLVRRGIVAAAAGAAATWAGVASLAPLPGPGKLEVHILDVGQGDAILLRTPGGQDILVDGGPSGITLARELGAVLPHWDRTLDFVVLTHAQEDHVAGLVEALRQFDVGTLAEGSTTSTSLSYRLFAEHAGRAVLLQRHDLIAIDGVRIEVAWAPPDGEGWSANDASVVLRVRYGDAVLLLTGDIEAGAQQVLVEQGGIRAQVLKVPHHGAATSDAAFFRAVGADVSLIPVGASNPYGHPREETLALLGSVAVFRTDIHGRISLSTDGAAWRVWTER